MSKEITVGAKYVSKKYGVVTVVKFDDKTKTVRFTKAGSEKQEPPMTAPSFKRTFEPVAPEEKSEKKAETKAEPKAEQKSVDTEKKAPQKAEKPEKKKAEKKTGKSEAERLAVRDDLVKAFTKCGAIANVPALYPMIVYVKLADKNIIGISLSSGHIRVRAISELLPKTITYKKVKSELDASVNFEYSDTKAIVEIVEYATKNFKDSDIVKRKRKAEKKAEPKVEKKAEKKPEPKAEKKAEVSKPAKQSEVEKTK